MASTTTFPAGSLGAPGAVVYPGAANNAQLFNDMNIIIPELIPDLFDRYGAEQYGMLMDFMGPIGSGVMRSRVESKTTGTRQFMHYEKGRAFSSGTVNANVAASTPGGSITIVLAAGSYTNAGTESGFRTNEIGYIGSTGVKFQVGAITRTTSAFSIILKPVNAGETLSSAGSTNCLAGEALFLVGNQAAGEASDAMDSQNSLIYKITNNTTEIRDDYSITDVAMMNNTPINFGGGSYSYYKLGQTELNKRFMYWVENAVFEGVNATNLSNGSIGTTGIIPTVTAAAPEVDYTSGNATLGDIQALVTQLLNQGGKGEYHVIQETNQQDDVDDLFFGKYNNGAIRYASVGGDERASVSYGFKSVNVKGMTLHFWVYKNWTPQSIYGLVPTLGAFRQNFGLAIPQGVVPDAKSESLYPNMQFVYQEVTPGTKFYTWETGALAGANKTTVLKKTLSQACYVGARCIAPQQFGVLKGTY